MYDSVRAWSARFELHVAPLPARKRAVSSRSEAADLVALAASNATQRTSLRKIVCRHGSTHRVIACVYGQRDRPIPRAKSPGVGNAPTAMRSVATGSKHGA